jgi:hypothetical protein
MNEIPAILLIVGALFSIGAITALILSGISATGYQNQLKLNELEEMMRKAHGGTNDHPTARRDIQ